MKTFKRILALLAVILLVSLYVIALFFSISDHPNASDWLLAAIFSTLFIPVTLYAILIAAKIVRRDHDEAPQLPPPMPSPEEQLIDTIIFDLGNVLVSYDWQTLLADMGYNKEQSAILGKAIFESDEWTESDRGILSDEEILQSFIQNAPSYEEDIRSIFAQIGKTITVFPYTKEWLEELHLRGFKLYYLSNYSHPLFQQSKETLSFLSRMDGGYFSHQIKCMKPEKQIFNKLLDDFSLDYWKCLFIDDRLEHVAGARACDIEALHFTSYEKVAEYLKKI